MPQAAGSRHSTIIRNYFKSKLISCCAGPPAEIEAVRPLVLGLSYFSGTAYTNSGGRLVHGGTADDTVDRHLIFPRRHAVSLGKGGHVVAAVGRDLAGRGVHGPLDMTAWHKHDRAFGDRLALECNPSLDATSLTPGPRWEQPGEMPTKTRTPTT